jgi:hypothetical protein
MFIARFLVPYTERWQEVHALTDGAVGTGIGEPTAK